MTVIKWTYKGEEKAELAVSPIYGGGLPGTKLHLKILIKNGSWSLHLLGVNIFKNKNHYNWRDPVDNG